MAVNTESLNALLTEAGQKVHDLVQVSEKVKKSLAGWKAEADTLDSKLAQCAELDAQIAVKQAKVEALDQRASSLNDKIADLKKAASEL